MLWISLIVTIEKVCRINPSVAWDPLTSFLRDHETRNAWIGPSFPLDLSTLPVKSDVVPLQYPSLSKCIANLIQR